MAQRAGLSAQQRMGYRRIVTLLVTLIIVPTVLLLSLGIVLLFLGEAQANLLVGILTVAFVAVTFTGVVLVLVFLRRAATLSELQADFVSKVSHELRTPLTAIRLFVETMERSPSDAEIQAKCIAQLSKESDRLSSLIERLLDWGRMEAGRKLYDLKEERPSDIAQDAVAAFDPDRYADLSFSVESEGGLPNIMADRGAMVDALLNLLSNARKYGGAPCIVSLNVSLESPQWVRFSVKDNGEGIAREEQRRVFDKFYRIDDRLSRMREGSGLGLAIVKHTVTAHQGRVELKSEKGQGSTFSIVLPVISGEANTRS